MDITDHEARAAQQMMYKVIDDLKSIRLFLRRPDVDDMKNPTIVYLAEAADKVHDAANALQKTMLGPEFAELFEELETTSE